MQKPGENTTFLKIQSIIYSLLIHICLFSMIIIRFPTHESTPMPTIVFLGSILRNYDVVDSQWIKKERRDQPFTYLKNTASKHSKNMPILKPSMTSSVKQIHHTKVKTTFDNLIENQDSNIKKGLSPKIVPDLPPYKSIKYTNQ